MSEDLVIRPATGRDARAYHDFWRAIVAEERFVRTESVREPVRAFRRRFRRASASELHLLAFRGDRLVGHVTIERIDIR